MLCEKIIPEGIIAPVARRGRRPQKNWFTVYLASSYA